MNSFQLIDKISELYNIALKNKFIKWHEMSKYKDFVFNDVGISLRRDYVCLMFLINSYIYDIHITYDGKIEYIDGDNTILEKQYNMLKNAIMEMV
jgi:hypothetical protein